MNLGTTVKVAGGLFPTQLLERLLAGDPTLVGTRPADFHEGSATELNQAINRAWTTLVGRWTTFKAARAQLAEGDRATSLTRDRWLLPLLQELGYGRLQAARSAIVADDRSFAISHQWGHVPIHLIGAGLALDKRVPGERGAAASPPHGLVQDLLNHADGHLWAFLSNGLELRLLRDHRSLTRHAYVSFDLEAMFDGEQFNAFRLLYLLCHQSRVEGDDPQQCWLERWVILAQQDGVAARDRLQAGVQVALVALGGGFIRHQANASLKARLASNALSKDEYYRQLLRLVYRLLFLFVAEDRELLLVPDAPEVAKQRFRAIYATRRLRTIAMKRRGGPHEDGWRGLCVLMRQLDRGNADLALPALGSFLWRTEEVGGARISHAIPDLDTAALANEDLYTALAALCLVQDGPVRRPVDWAGVQSDELGSVYEALMEKVPRINVPAGTFQLADAPGNERKTTGSYYTPSSLVDCLLDSALDPVLEAAARASDPERAILDLTVVDPACGSGHFLVAAARRIAHRLARVRCGGIEPSPPDVQHALRDVVGRCIYGVDLNPMAVELCQVSLWMEAIEPGRPLSFLGGHIRHGHALVGATPELMDKGIPDEAWAPIEGDDKAIAKRLKKANRDRLQMEAFVAGTAVSGPSLAELAAAVEDRDDSTLGGVEAKEAAQRALDAVAQAEWSLADLWCSAFVWPKQTLEDERAAPIDSAWTFMRSHPTAVPEPTRRRCAELARQNHFFHWHLAFPRVHARGGFDVCLGNPPWERVKLQEQEFFATRSEAIANAPNAAARKKLIAALPFTDPVLWDDWSAASRAAAGQSHFVRNAGRYPLSGKGDVNTYALFAEHNRSLLNPKGRAGFIVPTGLATDDSTKELFGGMVEGRELASFYSFENEELVFPAVHHAFRFALLTVDRSGRCGAADLVFFARQTTALSDPDRHFKLTPEEFHLLNPNTHTCPTFRSRQDADLNLAIYRRAGVLWREGDPDGNPWGLRFMAMLHMANDSGLFRTAQELEGAGWREDGNRYVLDGRMMLPLVEAKMVHHFDHRFGTYRGQTEAGANQGKLPELDDEAHADPNTLTFPKYWVESTEVDGRLADRWGWEWLLGWRDICRSTDQRTMIASLVPKVAVGHKLPLMMPSKEPRLIACQYANLTSMALDYAVRQKVGGTSLTYFIVKQLPVVRPDCYQDDCEWSVSEIVRDWILDRVLELTYTAWDLRQFALGCGHNGPPFRWDAARRPILRAELDAAFFLLYGLSREDADYVLDTFPVVRNNDVKKHGEYRTKRLILEAYDALTTAMNTGRPYVSPLPPPTFAE
jgi:hypothetical protein